MLSLIRGLIGISFLLLVAWFFSSSKRKVPWKLVLSGLFIQLIFAVFVIHGEKMGECFFILSWPKKAIDLIGAIFVKILSFINHGSTFVFGSLGIPQGNEGSMGFFFAFQVLPTIIFFASLTATLYYLGILQKIVGWVASLVCKILGTSGAETLSCTANIFIGQTEAPLLIKPYIKTMTRSELFTVMVGGMATVAGGVMASYVQLLGQAWSEVHNIPLAEAQLKFAVQLVTASVMAAPAALVFSKIICPETLEPVTKGKVKVKVEKEGSNLLEAIASGASQGLTLALNVAAMLLVFIALIYLINFLLSWSGGLLGINDVLIQKFNKPLSMELVFGLILKYIAIIIGVPSKDAVAFGALFGTKTVLNEFVAYIDLVKMIKNSVLSEKGVIMSTFALCGFANFSSIAIQLGGISPLAPSRKGELASLGLKAVFGGALVTLETATLAGILL